MTHEHSGTIEELAQELLERRDGVKRLLEELLNAFPANSQLLSPTSPRRKLKKPGFVGLMSHRIDDVVDA